MNPYFPGASAPVAAVGTGLYSALCGPVSPLPSPPGACAAAFTGRGVPGAAVPGVGAGAVVGSGPAFGDVPSWGGPALSRGVPVSTTPHPGGPPNDRAVPPVDVATGQAVVTEADEPVLRRTHVSDYRLGRWFGATWVSTVDQRVEVEPDALRLLLDDGSLLSYPMPVNGSLVFPSDGSYLPLRRVRGGYEVTDIRNRVLFFNPYLSSIVDGDTRVVFHRDVAGNPVAVEHSGGQRLDVEIRDGLVTAMGTVRYRYERRRLVEVTDANRGSTRFVYDAAGRVVRWEDATGRWYRYYFDADGRVVRAGGPDGCLDRELAYDTGVTYVTNSLGHVTRYLLDERRRVVAVTDPLGNTTRYQWDDCDRLLAHTDGLGRITRYELDTAGNVLSVTYPDGNRLLQEYDERNRPIATVGVDGAMWHRAYDEHGKLVRTTDPAGAVTSYAYENGDLATVTDPLGGVTRIEADAPAVPDGLSRTYDTELRLTSVTNEQGQVWRYAYDPAGNLVSETDFDGHRHRYGYDAAGQLMLCGNGQTVAFDRDVRGRVIRRRVAGAVTEFAYDAAGRLTSARNADAEVAFTYDVLGRVVAESINGRTVRSEYDLAGRRTTRRTPSGAMSRFTYDAEHRPVALHTAGRAVCFSYDPAGREIARCLHGIVDDAVVELSYVDQEWPASEPADAKAGWRFQWDGGRLTCAIAPDGRRWRYRYDALGRRIAKQRLDSAGRIAEQTQFTWDGTNLAEEVRSGTGQPTVAVVWEWVPGTARVVTQTRRVLGRGDPDFHAVVTDPAGAPVELVDETGKVAWRRGDVEPGEAYTPLGRPGEYHDDELPHTVSSLTASGLIRSVSTS